MGENVKNKEEDRQLLEAIFNQNEFIMRQNDFIIKHMEDINKAMAQLSPYCYSSTGYVYMIEKGREALQETDEVRMRLSIDKPGRFL